MMNGTNFKKTIMEGIYLVEELGRTFVYETQTGNKYEANNLLINYLTPKSKYEIHDREYVNWNSWK